VDRSPAAGGIDGADQDADGLVGRRQLTQQGGCRHLRHGDDIETEGGVEAIGQGLGLVVA
jgi:hypothetical protein